MPPASDARPSESAAAFRFPARVADRLALRAALAERALRRLVGRLLRGRARGGPPPPAHATGMPSAAPARPRVAPRPDALPIVFLPAVAWDFRFQRPQQLARALAAAGHPVLYVDGFLRSRVMPERHVRHRDLNLEVLLVGVPGRPDPYREPPSAAAVERLALTLERGLLRPPGLVVAELPFWGPLARRLAGRHGAKLVYDRLDWHAGFAGVSAAVEALEAELLRTADLVTASSRDLAARSEGHGRAVRLLRNAVALEDFPAAPPPSRTPVRIGYVGALAEWFDAEAVERLARARPEWQIRLAGRVESGAVAALAALPNLRLDGEIAYRDVAAHLAEAAVTLVPFRDTPLTRAVDPVKLYEALAVGRPVVARRLPELEAWREPLVYLYSVPEELPVVVERALSGDSPEAAAARRAAVAPHTWTARAGELLEALEQRPTRCSASGPGAPDAGAPGSMAGRA